jgi:hypothetical protein
MLESPEEERQRLHRESREDLLKRLLSNTENFDKNLLTLASTLLAGSVAFIRPAPNSPGVIHAAVLAWSWGMLGVAIASTMVSFLTSQSAVERQLSLIFEYYIKGNDKSLTGTNAMAVVTLWLNRFAGFAFLVAVALTIWFAILTIPTR